MLIFHRENPTEIPQPKASLMQYQHVGASVEGARESAGEAAEEKDVSEEQVHATE